MRLEWDGCFNVRDLGGLACEGGRATRARVLVRSDDVGRLTPSGMQALFGHGIRSIVDLREPAEAGQFRYGRGGARLDPTVVRTHVPVIQSASLVAQKRIQASAVTFDTYTDVLTYCTSGVATAIRAFANAGQGGVVMHCAVGRDRTGLVVALVLSLCGVADAAIAQDYSESAAALAPFYWLLQRAIPDPARRAALLRENRAEAKDMLHILGWVRTKYTSTRGYLEHAGLSAAELDRVVERLVG